jgi:hypothetical protein
VTADEMELHVLELGKRAPAQAAPLEHAAEVAAGLGPRRQSAGGV